MPEFPPIAHVAVTVTDLERSTRWYSGLLATGPVLDEDEQAGGFHHTVFAHGGIKDARYGSGVSFRDPDGIALEFFAPPA